MTDAPDFLSDEPSSEPAEIEPKAAPEAAAPASTEAPAPAPAPAPGAPAEPAPADPAAHPVPLATFLDTRDRAAKAEARAKELEAKIAEQEAKSRQPIPDRNQDPEAFEDFRAQQYEERLLNMTLNNSERFATISHGKETVDQAKAWALERFQADPLYHQKVMSSSDAYELVVQDFKQSQAMTALNDPGALDAFLAWHATQAAAPQAGQPLQSPQPAPAIRAPAPVAPRASLAGAPSAGRSSAPEARDGASTFGAMFGD